MPRRAAPRRRSLETAVANGYTGAKEVAEDADLAPLGGEARFQALLQKLR